MGRPFHRDGQETPVVKILFAIKTLDSIAGGAERVLSIVASGLVDRGHEVSIVTFDQPGGRPFYHLDPRIRKIDLAVGEPSNRTKFIEALLRIKALREFAQAERPDAAIGFMHSIYVPMAFALLGTGIIALGSEHIVPEHYRSRRLEYALLLFSAPFLSGMTVLSEQTQLRYPAIVRRRMTVMPNPVDLSLKDLQISTDMKTCTLLSVGRLDEQKDHESLIRAFRSIAFEYPEWQLRIIGDGPLRPHLEELVAALDLRDRVHLPGKISEIGNEYRAAEIFVIPSRYESFGLVTAEAMSIGLPVVGFADCPGTNELIDSGRTGLLVEPGEDRVASLASSLSSLMADSAARRVFGARARAAMDGRYSPNRICDEWEKLLNYLREGC